MRTVVVNSYDGRPTHRRIDFETCSLNHEGMGPTNRGIGVGTLVLAVVLLAGGGCTTVERNANDAAQTRTSVTPTSLVSALNVTAPTSEWNSEELARVLLNAEERTIPFDRLTAPLLRQGLAEDAAVDAVCNALGQVLLGGPGLTRDALFGIIFSNLIASLHGDQIAALRAGQGIVNELSDGTTNDQLWARVALSKSGHCRLQSS